MTKLPLLSFCLFWPAFGALSLAFVRDTDRAKWASMAVAGIELLLTLVALYTFNPNEADFQLVEDHIWIANLNVHYHLGVDGISVLFLPATALLTLMAIAASWQSAMRLTRLHLALLLILECITIGVFTALDLVLFFLFWELTLPPLFFLIGLWGIGAERRHAAMKYTLYMLFGGVPLLFGFIILSMNYAGSSGITIPQELCFNLPKLLQASLHSSTQSTVFFLLMLGFAVKAPLPPFHTWLPTVAMEAPPPVSALLTGLKLGVYGIIRFAIPLAPAAAREYNGQLAIVGAIALIYGALIALQQSNLRRLLAYASVSHVGLVLLGIATFTLQGLQGAVMQLLNFSIVAASLMLIAGMIQQRLGSTESIHLGGLAKPMPRLTTLFFLFALSGIGVPGTNGFPAELLIFLGTLQVYPTISLTVLFAAVLGAAYSFGFIRNGFFGPIQYSPVARCQDLCALELRLLAPAALLVLVLGFAPQWLLSVQETTLNVWIQRLAQIPQSRLARAPEEFFPSGFANTVMLEAH
ncbi:MAG: complex I subunit 4 family protein [Gammaproteobacteria bacterium]